MMDLQIKYCGCRNLEDYILLSSSKATIIGFIFANSKRKVSIGETAKWVRSFEKTKKLAGVFQNAPLDEMIRASEEIPLDIIQCHGNESPDFIMKVKENTRKLVFKAIPFNDEVMTSIEAYSNSADAVIIDSVADGQFGGTGIPFTWSKIPELLQEAEKFHLPLFIAGGIHSSNVEALLSYRPYGIDLSGGIESDGKKSAERINELERKICDVNYNRS
jgi:phosphoribosylanthranilate isomerase